MTNERDYTSELATKCQEAARRLTYNEGDSEATAKHLLLEASHALDSHSVSVHQKTDGPMLINARGKVRFMTLRERVACWLLGGNLEIRP